MQRGAPATDNNSVSTTTAIDQVVRLLGRSIAVIRAHNFQPVLGSSVAPAAISLWPMVLVWRSLHSPPPHPHRLRLDSARIPLGLCSDSLAETLSKLSSAVRAESELSARTVLAVLALSDRTLLGQS